MPLSLINMVWWLWIGLDLSPQELHYSVENLFHTSFRPKSQIRWSHLHKVVGTHIQISLTYLFITFNIALEDLDIGVCVYLFPFITHGTVRAFTACEYNILDIHSITGCKFRSAKQNVYIWWCTTIVLILWLYYSCDVDRTSAKMKSLVDGKVKFLVDGKSC